MLGSLSWDALDEYVSHLFIDARCGKLNNWIKTKLAQQNETETDRKKQNRSVITEENWLLVQKTQD